MILLDEGTLFFSTSEGETVPLRADMIFIETSSEDEAQKELIQHAVAAVFHYFKHDLGRTVVSFGEFSLAIEQVLQSLGINAEVVCEEEPRSNFIDLRQVADRSNMNELVFFAQLRPLIRAAFENAVKHGIDPVFLRFTGLRQCVKTIFGVERWTERCEKLEGEVLEYIRAMAQTEGCGRKCILWID